ncbi:MAG: Hint domain-containing protein, partial [Candidatus Micrarchaeota archaeon]
MFPSQAKTVIKKALENPENTQPMFFWGPPGIGKCLHPKTKVMIPGGWRNIEDIKESDYVLGLEKGIIKPCLVTGIHRAIIENPIEVNSSGKTIICSPEHRILTTSGWSEAGHLTPTSHIIAVDIVGLPQKGNAYVENQAKTMVFRRKGETPRTLETGKNFCGDCSGIKQDSKFDLQAKVASEISSRAEYRRVAVAPRSDSTHMETTANSNRISLYSRDNRWGGNDIFSGGQQRIECSPLRVRDQHFSEANKLFNGDCRLDTNRRKTKIQSRKLHAGFGKGIKNGRDPETNFAVPYYQKGLSRDGSKVYRIKEDACARISLHRGGMGVGAYGETSKQQQGTISAGTKTSGEEGERTQFCDITTSFGNYIAEGIIVHNSAIPRELCNEMKIGFVDMRLAQRDPTDLRGIPAVIDGKARWLPAPELPTSGQGILMLDELTSAPPLTQASAYQLTL